MTAQVVRSERLLRLAMLETAHQEHDDTDWELSEEEVWEVASLHAATATQRSTSYDGAAAAARKTTQAAVESWLSRSCRRLPRSGSSVSLTTQKHGATSAPVGVPEGAAGAAAEAAMEAAMRKERKAAVSARSLNIVVQVSRRGGEGGYGDEQDDEEGGGIIPPHVIASSQHRSAMACSVMEGAGRTLKGRDLRNVRNAVWKQTGFFG